MIGCYCLNRLYLLNHHTITTSTLHQVKRNPILKSKLDNLGMNMSSAPYEITDVLVCGCGPTGAMLSGYLSRMGIKNIVIEKEPQITTDPRGIALDDDGIRYLQGLGLYDHIFSDIGSCTWHPSVVHLHEVAKIQQVLTRFALLMGFIMIYSANRCSPSTWAR